MGTEERHDAEANRRALERARQETERIRASQPEQVPYEGGEAKQPLPLWAARVVSAVAFLLPLRVRVRFIYTMNFLYNSLGASVRMAFGWLGVHLTRIMIFASYFLVLGPTALLARLFGADPLGLRRSGDSYFTTKEPADASEERFSRQY